MDLIIVESPTKAKTLSRFLGKDYLIEATYGHIRDLPKSKIGVDVDDDFAVDYVVTDKQKTRVALLKKAKKGAKETYLATDPDREGEAIAWHTSEMIGAGTVKRIVFHEITETAIKEAIEHPRKLDMKLVDAQQARRVLDRLVGYKLSPLLWRKIRTGLSAGRVQSVTVKLVVEREREIEAFKAVEYWDVRVELQNSKAPSSVEATAGKQKFQAKLVKDIANQKQAEKVEKDLENAEYNVASVEKKEFRRIPPAPFTTSTLQQTAANRLGWSAKKTMQAAQRLYEEGQITYHRTDSTNIANEAAISCSQFIVRSFGKEYALGKPRFYKTKSKVAQEAHEAIRPTDVSTTPPAGTPPNLGGVGGGMGNDEKKLYELIWKRFVACQVAEVRGENTKVQVSAGEYKLEVAGEQIEFDGWYKILGKDIEENLLPELTEGEKLELIQIIKEQKFTQPPSRYNDASLIKILEEMGIGRPSTYAPTLATIVERRYVEREDPAFAKGYGGHGKRYKPTNLGIAVNDFLVQYFAKIVDYDFTANLENSLDEIANGEKEWRPVIAEFYGPFAKDLESTQENATRVKIKVENTGEICPKCGEGEQVIRAGKFGKFLACSRFPECDWKDKYEIKAGMKCPKCTSGDVIVKKTRRGRPFYGCSNYPTCDFASWVLPQVEKPA